MTLVGVLGGRTRAIVDPRGHVAITDAGWTLGWWIGADDRWRIPSRESAVRQTLVDDAPVVQTSMRVPSGDAVERVYAVSSGGGDLVVVEVENTSPAPFVAAFVVRGARAVRADGDRIVVDGRTMLLGPRAPSRWAVTKGGTTEVEVWSGAARSGPFPAMRDRAGRIEAAFLYPVPHRTTLRVALAGHLSADGAPLDATTVRSAPDAVAAARGWQAQLDRGMRVVLPDEALGHRVRSARAEALLATVRPTGAGAAALEDWGFDEEAAEAWNNLSGRERRRAARRADHPATWADLAAARGGSELLLAVRSLLVHERDDVVIVLSELPREWRGQPVEVHGAPTRGGLVSYALRWHGTRPALLWDAPSGVTLAAPGLDPSWSTTEPTGEVLLSEVAA